MSKKPSALMIEYFEYLIENREGGGGSPCDLDYADDLELQEFFGDWNPELSQELLKLTIEYGGNYLLSEFV